MHGAVLESMWKYTLKCGDAYKKVVNSHMTLPAGSVIMILHTLRLKREQRAGIFLP